MRLRLVHFEVKITDEREKINVNVSNIIFKLCFFIWVTKIHGSSTSSVRVIESFKYVKKTQLVVLLRCLVHCLVYYCSVLLFNTMSFY